MTSSAKPRLLCVDDEERVLQGLKRTLRRHFEVVGVTRGAEGLERLATDGPFELVVSDMQMPEMNGAEFLTKARQVAPDTIRFLLTGHADIDSAIEAVNEGAIFRFLSKPCAPPKLLAALQAGLEQHRLVTSERELLGETLHGAVAALTEVLSLVQPAAFGRASRVHRVASRIADAAALEPRWVLDIAAMMSSVGAIVLPPETAEKLHTGEPLSKEEREMAARIPAVADSLLANIPRLEPVRETLQQRARAEGSDGSALTAKVLRLAEEYDDLLRKTMTRDQALDVLESSGHHDRDLLEILRTADDFEDLQMVQLVELELRQVAPGMVFHSDVVSATGVLLVTHGQAATPQLLERLHNIAARVGIEEPVTIAQRRRGANDLPPPTLRSGDLDPPVSVARP